MLAKNDGIGPDMDFFGYQPFQRVKFPVFPGLSQRTQKFIIDARNGVSFLEKAFAN
jgi:hypothetical protein